MSKGMRGRAKGIRCLLGPAHSFWNRISLTANYEREIGAAFRHTAGRAGVPGDPNRWRLNASQPT